MTSIKFSSQKQISSLEEATYTWKSPSNIALVKYWGKKEVQIPQNPSISFTLKNCHTITSLKVKKRAVPSDTVEFDFYFENQQHEAFKPKINQFFKKALPFLPNLKQYKIEIHSKNSFPHSSGIASSASSMSALALCLMAMEKDLNPTLAPEEFHKKASFLSRLASGSACRSIEGPVMVWGVHSEIKGSADEYAIPFPDTVHQNFHNYQNAILLIDKGQKEVSSTAGHQLMYNHPFAEKRFQQARENTQKLKEILVSGNLSAFIELVELEALSLHAMMQTSSPSYFLVKPNTLAAIEKIQKFRAATKLNLCFTLDAGPNIHLLYPENEKKAVKNFIDSELLQLCYEQAVIYDEVGKGAEQL